MERKKKEEAQDSLEKKGRRGGESESAGQTSTNKGPSYG